MKALAKMTGAAHADPVLSQADVDAIPPLFAFCNLVGHCMEPFIPNGTKLAFDRAEKVQAGDVAAIIWAPGKNAPGSFQAQVKQIVSPAGADGQFVYRMFRPYLVLRGRQADVLAIIKCVGIKSANDSLRKMDFASIISAFEVVVP